VTRTARLIAFAMLTVACNSPTEDCSDVGHDGLAMVITDSITGASLQSQALVTVRQLTAPFETRTGSIAAPPSPLDLAARPGPYRITVIVVGYETWERDVTVQQTTGRCPETITLTVVARLVPSTQQ
jgi:hypothetical protein